MAEHPTPIQCQIIDFLENGPKRKVICAFRGCGKSTLSAMYLLWRLYINPDEKCLIISASLTRAEAMTAWMLSTITNVDWLRHMKPDSHDGRYSKLAFDVGTCRYIEQSPSVRAAGVTGQVTGSRASIILPDDIETPITAMTQVQRQKIRTVVDELEAILKPADECPTAEITYLGTPHSSDESTYFYLNRTLNFSMRCWPARVPEAHEPYRRTLAPLIFQRMPDDIGRPTDTRFSDEELKLREFSMSPAKWKLQFMLDPTLTDTEKYPLRCGDLIVMTLDGTLPEVVTYEKARYLMIRDIPCPGMGHDPTYYRPQSFEGSIRADVVPTVLVLDPSGGGADEFAWAVVKAWAGNYYLMDIGGKRGGVDEEFWHRIAMKAKEHEVNKILVETNFGGLEIYQQVLKPYLSRVGHPCSVEGVKAAGQRKEVRIIDTLAPVIQTHKMIVARKVVEDDAEWIRNCADEDDVDYSAFYQLTRITYDRGALTHDDRLDAWAMGVQWFQKQAAQDQKVMREVRKAELLNAEIEDEFGYALLSTQRMAMGMTLEQARRADSSHVVGNIFSGMRKRR